MKSYVIDELKDRDQFQQFLSFFDSLSDSEPAQIYVDSNGGPVHYFLMASDRIKRESSVRNVVLRVVTAGSMALRLAWENRDIVTLERQAEGVAHSEAIALHVFNHGGRLIARNSDPVTEGRYLNTVPFDYPFLKELEKIEYFSGKDVYLSNDRMKEIFPT